MTVTASMLVLVTWTFLSVIFGIVVGKVIKLGDR